MFQVCEAGLHISLGFGLHLLKLLEHDLQLLDLEMSVQTEEEERTAVQQQLICLLKNVQALEDEAYSLAEEASHHQEVIDWFCACAHPVPDLEENTPIEVQLAQLRAH